MALAQKTMRTAVSRRSAVVVRASQESRRAVLSGLAAGVALTLGRAAQANTPVDLLDDRAAKAKGFDIIYEARELDLPQSVRDGLTQGRQNIDATKKRAKESEARLDTKMEAFIKKAYWTEAREELRRQVGTLRFDLATLAGSNKKNMALRKDFIAKVEALDFSIRKAQSSKLEKDQQEALAKLSEAQSALDVVLAAVL